MINMHHTIVTITTTTAVVHWFLLHTTTWKFEQFASLRTGKVHVISMQPCLPSPGAHCAQPSCWMVGSQFACRQ